MKEGKKKTKFALRVNIYVIRMQQSIAMKK